MFVAIVRFLLVGSEVAMPESDRCFPLANLRGILHEREICSRPHSFDRFAAAYTCSSFGTRVMADFPAEVGKSEKSCKCMEFGVTI